MSGKKKNVISKASPHTIKKFELIEEYIKSWAQKLLLNDSCNGLIFIDCMCNSGIYTDDDGNPVKGTALRVSEALREAARTYTEKNIHIYLNDKDKARVDELEKHLPNDERNFKIVTSRGDAHELLRTIGPQLYGTGHLHYFLLYDPYDATIDWEALLPFFRNWGEVMINHMVSDPVRAITSAKKKTTKEKYENVFDFIPFREDMLERDIEQALVRDVTKLLLELGTGFAFLGNQYHLNVGGDDFYIDLLFYNLNLRCYVVVELKTGEFKPEYAGQLNFYLSAVDGILKKDADNPSIGLLLCKSKNNLVAEYSLKDISKPIGVSEYKVTSNLTGELEKQLPSVEDIQNRIK